MIKNNFLFLLLNGSLLLFSLGQLARISLPDRPIFFYAYEVLIGLLTIILIFRFKLQPLRSIKSKPILAFMFWMFLSFAFSAFSYPFEQNIVAFLYFVRLLLYFGFFIYLSAFLESQKNTKHSIVLISATVFIIATSFVQYFLYQNLGNLAYLGWDPHLYRVVGLFFDPPITISVYILFVLYYLLDRKDMKSRMVTILLVFPLLVLSFLTYSRGGFLGIIAICALYVLRQRNWKVILIGFLILAGGFLLLPKGSSEGINLLRTTSIEARINDYEKAITIWKKNPISGIGYNHIRYEKDPYEEQTYYGPYNPSHGSTAFHSSFLVVLVTGGLIGLLFYMWVLVTLAKQSEFMLYSVLFLSIVSLFDNVLLHPFVLYLLFFLQSNLQSLKRR